LTNDTWQALQQIASSHNLALQRAGMEASETWRKNLEQNHRETMSASST